MLIKRKVFVYFLLYFTLLFKVFLLQKQTKAKSINPNRLRTLTSLKIPSYLVREDYKIQYDYREKTWPDLCKTGKMQSPIKIPLSLQKLKKDKDIFEVISSKYNETFLKKSLQEELTGKNGTSYMSLDVSNNGYIMVEKRDVIYRYYISHISFVFPPEHILDDSNHDLEMQMVHIKDLKYLQEKKILNDPDAGRDKLIISILFQASHPDPNTNLQKLRVSMVGNVDKKFNLSLYPPINRGILFYEGSLTKPPCTENVNWAISLKPEYMDKQQLQDFAGWFIDKGYSTRGNARNVQPINGRTIYYSYKHKETDIHDKGTFIRSLAAVVVIMYIFIF